MELQEAAQINQGLQTANVGRDTSVHDMKAIVKTWRYTACPDCLQFYCSRSSEVSDHSLDGKQQKQSSKNRHSAGD